MKRGLVLEGGGAKGAFQFGVIQALRKEGVTFDAVAGTSVGALNAVLVGTDNLDLGERLWNDMSLGRAFRWRFLALPLAIPGALARLYMDYGSGRVMKEQPLFLTVLFHLLAVLPSLIFMVFLGLTVCTEWWSQLWLGCLILASTGVIKSLEFRATCVFNGVFLGVICLWQWYIGEIPAEFWFLAVLFCSPGFLWVLGYIHQFFNLSVFNAAPLSETVSLSLHSGFKIPVLVTTAQKADEQYDPDNYSYTLFGPRGTTWIPTFFAAYVPSYPCINELPLERSRELVLASAALPFGIAPSRKGEGGQWLIDGGIVDNTPWFPLIEEGCDEIIIVLCNPATDFTQEAMLSQWQQRDRLQRVISKAFRPPAIPRTSIMQDIPMGVHNEPPVEVPLRTPETWPSRVTVIAPDQSLGSFWSATLNFEGMRARSLVQLGYNQGQMALSRLHQQ